MNIKRLHSFSGHRDCIYNLQAANKSNHFFSASGDGMIVLWDLTTLSDGELIATLPNSVYALHYHQPTGLLVAGNNYNGIHFLNWKEKREEGSLQMTKSAIFDIQSYGSILFVGDKDGVLSKVDIVERKVITRKRISEQSIRSIAININRGEVAVGSSDNFIRVFDLETLELVHEWEGHLNSVFTVRYTPDSNYLFSGSRDARLKVWDVASGYIKAAELVAHMYAINHIEFSPDSKHFVTCSLDRSIKVWDLSELRLLKVIDKARHAGHGTSVNRLLWTRHQIQLVSAGDDKTISVWDIEADNLGLGT